MFSTSTVLKVVEAWDILLTAIYAVLHLSVKSYVGGNLLMGTVHSSMCNEREKEVG